MVYTVAPVPLTKVQRLYGADVKPQIWKRFPYEDIFIIKIRRAKERIAYLYLEPILYRDWSGINRCVASIKHNLELMKEESL